MRNGFEDNSLYNDELMRLDNLELKEFDELKKIIGQTKAMPKPTVNINNQGLTDEEIKKEESENKSKKPLTEEEKQQLAELKRRKRIGIPPSPFFAVSPSACLCLYMVRISTMKTPS